MPLEIAMIPVLADNYVWLAHDDRSGETAVVDPAASGPVLEAASARGWGITQIWNTHWHPDHTGGNVAIVAATGCTVIGPAAEGGRIPGLVRGVAEGDTVSLGASTFDVWDVPAHTSGHVAFHMQGDDGLIFVGDTLFAMGCGRLLEGTAQQMFANMVRLARLPDATRVYCAHEYTQSNGRFALVAEPDNRAIIDRMRAVDAARRRGDGTIPTTIDLERKTNPFMRATTVAQFAELRVRKDIFTD